jgi:hypothetical protein
VTPCPEHPAQEARFECLSCKRHACPLCARRVAAGDGRTYCCVRCGAVMQALAGVSARAIGTLAAEAQKNEPIFARLLRAPEYLTKKSVLIILGCTALATTIIRFLSGKSPGMIGFGVGSVASGIEAALFFRMLETTADGEDELVLRETIASRGEIIHSLLVYLAAAGPIVLAFCWYAWSFPLGFTIGLLVALIEPRLVLHQHGPAELLLFGVAVWPLLLIGGALGKSIVEIYKPANWVKTIRVMKIDYLWAALAFYVIVFAQSFLVMPIAIKVGLKIPYLGPVVGTFFSTCVMALEARVLGLACRPYV